MFYMYSDIRKWFVKRIELVIHNNHLKSLKKLPCAELNEDSNFYLSFMEKQFFILIIKL